MTNLESIINQAIDHAWLGRVDFANIKDYKGDHPALAEKYPLRKFRQLLWDVVGCEVSVGDLQQFTSEEQCLIVYASFYGIPASERVPYQKGDGLRVEDHEVTITDIGFEYHTQYLVDNSYKLSKEEGEQEPAISPPPPTEPELDDPIVFDPKVTGIWDHLLALMTDEQKTQLKEQAQNETASPSYRHVGTTERERSPPSESVHSRGPSRSKPTYLGVVAIAANKANIFVSFADVMNMVVPCSLRESIAVFSSPPWVHRLAFCTTPEDVMEVFHLYHLTSWSDEDNASRDPVLRTKRGTQRYQKIRRRYKILMDHAARSEEDPNDYGEDNFSSVDEAIRVESPPDLKFRPVVPGDFVLTFGILTLANSLESQFPHRSEYWWTLLEGNLDQACTCFSMQAWVDQLKTCEDEESFKTTYQSFLDTTWQALLWEKQCTGVFPYVQPAEDEIRRAYYMKNRTLLLHNQIVWGEGADNDRPKIPTRGEQPEQESSKKRTSRTTKKRKDRSDDHGDSDDPHDPRSGANPPSIGDEAQDKSKQKDEKEATLKEGDQEQLPETEEQRAAREAQERIQELEKQLKEARDAARKAADDKARKTGDELIQEVEDEKAKKERKREKKKEKKHRKKQRKEGDPEPPSDDDDEEDSDEEEKEGEDKPEGESKKRPEGESKEEGDKPTCQDKKPEGEEKPDEKTKPEGEEKKEESEEGPPKDKEPQETWAEVLRKARKPRQTTSKAAERARARTYPRPMCESTAKPNYAYPRPQHVPTKDTLYSGRWTVNERPKDVQKRSTLKLAKEHKPIWEYGVRSRYTDYKICVLQVLNARKQTPPRGSPFALESTDVYWVQTTMQLHEDGSIPFSELPGMYPVLRL